MADEIATASVSVNVDRVSGSVSGSSNETNVILRQILAAMQEANKQAFATQRKEESGLSGKTMALGKAGAAIGIAAAIAGVAGAGTRAGLESMQMNGWMKQQDPETGEENVLRINTQTGEILEVLSMREAIEQRIVDENGQVYEQYKLQGKGLGIINSQYSVVGDVIKEKITVLDDQIKQEREQLAEQKAITENLREYNRYLAERNKKKGLHGASGMGFTQDPDSTPRGRLVSHDEVQTRDRLLQAELQRTSPYLDFLSGGGWG